MKSYRYYCTAGNNDTMAIFTVLTISLRVLELVGYIAGLFYIPFKWRKYTPRLDLEQDLC